MSKEELEAWLASIPIVRSSYYRRWPHPYRQRLKYRRKPHHKPKVEVEEDDHKKTWRKRKGFGRHPQGYNRGRAMKTWAKKESNGKYRRMIRDYIRLEQYDKIGNITPKSVFDPWMWD